MNKDKTECKMLGSIKEPECNSNTNYDTYIMEVPPDSDELVGDPPGYSELKKNGKAVKSCGGTTAEWAASDI